MATQEQAKIALNALIKRYNENKQDKDFCKNESQISNSLIKPFVNLVLGYDTAEPSEFKVESSMGGKRSDMLVCLNGVTQFVIEAKSLTHDIRRDYQYYQQAIRYASYKEKKFAILTNFKHLVILDAEIETEPLKAEVASIDIENLKENDFDILWSFSKEIWKEKGEGNEILLKLKGKKKQKIDEQLLDDLKKWRESLHNSLKKHPLKNKYDFHEDSGKIEEEIQKFIDRLVFICYCEDKQLIDVELKPIINDKDKYWEKEWYVLERIRKLFEIYQKNYNSDLFNGSWCDKFYFDDHTLLSVLKDLRQPKEKQPYDFSVIEADILGKTYENFIGHVLTGEKRFKEKESKGKRKSEGIYYTPVYIVDYIVRNTVKEYIKGKSIASINKVKILDPACGSGSFLIKAFDILVEECEKIRKLTYEEKRDLMLNCIFGVDKDERAVEICKLNLSLKLAERGQKLPELHDNIKCGDSLIDDKEIAGDKAFNWNEKFKSIMDNDGFDVVIGNPPYGAEFSNNEKVFFYKSYEVSEYQLDSYILFLEKGIKLLKENSNIGLIIPNPWLTNVRLKKLRNFILNSCKIFNIVYISQKVFKDAVVDTVIIIFQKEKSKNNRINNRIKIEIANDISLQGKKYNIEQLRWSNKDSNNFNIFMDDSSFKISTKIKEKCCVLGDVFEVRAGIEPYEVGKGKPKQTKSIVEEKIYNAEYKKDSTYKPYLRGSDINRYIVKWDSRHWISYGECLAAPRKPENFEKVKIVIRQTGDSLISVLDTEKFLTMKNTHIILPTSDLDLKYCLCLLNSKLMTYYFRTLNPEKGEALAEVKAEYVKQLPVKRVSKENQQPFINLVDKMLSLNEKLQEIGDKSTMEKEKIQKEIQKTDNEIDELVYQLYGITEEEKKIIEESLK